MASRATESLLVHPRDLSALRQRVTELAADDPVCAERLLGQFATLEAHASGRRSDEPIAFVPLPGCERLAERVLAALNAPAFAAERRKRFRR
jgi:hypothetical protein